MKSFKWFTLTKYNNYASWEVETHERYVHATRRRAVILKDIPWAVVVIAKEVPN